MHKATLTAEQESILREQVFDAMHPGTLLHDFGVVLDYVGEKGVKAGGKYNLLPISAIHVLDARLARPLKLLLKRPQLRSHPYLQGLHLLLRASELGRVEGTGDKARLVVDPEAFQSWNQLNPTEQYFALLKAWLLESSPEMIGMHEGRSDTVLDGWLYSLRIAVTMPGDSEMRVRLASALIYFEQVFNGALADLFGMISIDKPLRAEPNYIAGKAHITDFGAALLTLLDTAAKEIREQRYEEESAESEPASPGSLFQSILQPYFPAWQNNLSPASLLPFEEGVYVYKVTLGDIWRRIAMRYDHTFHDLLRMILRSIKFDEDHLYSFKYRDPLGRTEEITHPACEGIPADTLELGEVPIKPGESLSLIYDFGDSWRFNVLFERIDPPGSVKKLPKLLESHGEAPQQYHNADW